MLHSVWPSQGVVSPRPPAKPVPPQLKRKHAIEPTPVAGLHWAACTGDAAHPQALPPIARLFLLTLLRTWTKMAAAREFPAFAFLADRRMRGAVSAVCLVGPAGVKTNKPTREEYAMTSTSLSR